MKFLKFIISLSLFGAWIYFFNKPIQSSKSTIPAIGNFMNPSTGFWQNSATEDVNFGKIKTDFVKHDVNVVWDKRLVPHIEANNLEDAFYVQGYSTASQRLWQMDMLSRSAGGRLAEVLGPNLLERDKTQRRMGMLLGAENALEGWKNDQENFKYLVSYTKGVNDWISQLNPKDFPIEYKLMGFTPEPWTELKSACVFKYMAQSLCSRESDLEASNTKALLGDSLYQFLYPAYFKEQSPIIPVTEDTWDYIRKKTEDTSNTYFDHQIENYNINGEAIPSGKYKRTTPVPPAGIGSNNWAVAGSKTKSGHPILCNDPHLRLTLPSIWFENHIHTPEVNAYGVSVPGIPGILIGWNDSIAWGETNVSHDVADWYQIKWTNKALSEYEVDGNHLSVNYKIEKFGVKGLPDIIDTVKYTIWGPVVSDTGANPHAGLAYHWIAHEKPSGFDALVFLRLMKAKNYLDYYNSLSHWSHPAQNFVFASRSGDIAITVNGSLPLKKNEQGKFVQDGSSSSNAWKGFIPYTDIPRVKNPSRGFVSSANQNSTDPSYPYYYNGDFDAFRGRTVNMELEKHTQIIPEMMMAMQNSSFNLKAQDNLPAMIGGLENNNFTSDQKSIIDKLRNWDYTYLPGSYEAICFNIWYRTFYRMTFDEIYSSKDSANLVYPKTFMTSLLMKEYPTHKIFDILSTPEKEISRDVLMKSFLFTIDSLNRLLPTERTWASYSKPKIQHMANLPGFSRENIQIGGSPESLNAINNGSGPSWRMVVDLGDTLNAYVVYPGGQSGNPASKYYDNMIDDWAKGNYYHALFDPKAYNSAKLGVQIFTNK